MRRTGFFQIATLATGFPRLDPGILSIGHSCEGAAEMLRLGIGSTAFAAMLLAAAPVWAQGGGAGGVFLDPDKVLRWTDKAKGKNATKMNRLRTAKSKTAESADLAYVSLPSLCREAKKLLDAGEKLPPEMTNLGGITRLQYIFVYPETKDLVIAGPAEDPAGDDPHRVLGASSGRPMLRLDDLAVCLRVLGPGKSPTPFGCSIDMPENGIANLQAASQKIGAVSGFNNDRVAKTLANAVGLQEVRFFGVPEDTNAAFVCIEADYILKRISHARLKSPVPAVKSYLALMRTGDGAYNRWWFTPNYESVRVSEDGLAYELRSKGLKVDCSSSQSTDDAPPGPGAKKFAEMVTQNFEGLEYGLTSFADLSNICDLAVLAAIIRRDELDRKTNDGMKWLLDPKGYKVATRATPRQVEPIANTKTIGSALAINVGGVSIDADGVARSQQKDSKLKAKNKRPTNSWMLRDGKEAAAGG
jgi:hypothetical protein